MSAQLHKSETSVENQPGLASNRLLAAAGRAALTAIAHFLALSTVLFVMCGPVLVFDQMYVDQGGKYPVLTVLIVNHAHWMSNYGWFLLYLPAVLLNAMVLVVLNMLPAKWRWIPRCYSTLVLLAALFYVSIAFAAMSVPQGFAAEQFEN